MIQEARKKYYYPCMAKYIKKWVSNCQICIQTKHINNDLPRIEHNYCPEWDFGPEDILQMDILPNLPPSGGYDHILRCHRCLLQILVCLSCNSYYCHSSIKSHHGHPIQTHIPSKNDNHGFRHSIQCKSNSRTCSSTRN